MYLTQNWVLRADIGLISHCLEYKLDVVLHNLIDSLKLISNCKIHWVYEGFRLKKM